MIASCARRLPPSGGPPDVTPPFVIASAPDSGAARVPLDGEISITFSEGMEPRSTADAVSIAPMVTIDRRSWHGRMLTLQLARPLEPRKTYTLFVGIAARDRHGNNMKSGATVVFSTADSFPRGRIEGEIETRGFAAPGTFLWCYEAGRPNVPDSTARDFDALGLADEDGRFRIDGLAVPGRYKLWAFADLNHNHSFESAVDVLSAVDTVIDLTPDHPRITDLKTVVVNPHANGRVKGAVIDSTADSVGVVRVIAEGRDDSTLVITSDAAADGTFDIELRPGRWWVRAYRDVDHDRVWQADRERASERTAVTIEPAADVVDVKLRLRPIRSGPRGEKP
jgi:hypothetical protein